LPARRPGAPGERLGRADRRGVRDRRRRRRGLFRTAPGLSDFLPVDPVRRRRRHLRGRAGREPTFPRARRQAAIPPLPTPRRPRRRGRPEGFRVGRLTMNFDQYRAAYDRDGFVVVRQLLSPEEFADLKANLDRYVREVVPGLPDAAAFYEDKGNPATLKQMQ